MNNTVNAEYASFGDIALELLSDNWVNILLIIVGASALVIYWLQERRKINEAASLVILQIDELQEKIKEIQSFIINSQLNSTAFYESQILFNTDYWNHYKHYFVRKMDSKSFRAINSLYECATEIQEQQQLMKNLQKNFFFSTQQVVANLETNFILAGLSTSEKCPVNTEQVVNGLRQTMPQDLQGESKTAIENLLSQFVDSNRNMDFSIFWNKYNRERSDMRTIIDKNGLTAYIPEQIRLSLEKAIKQYGLLEITSCDGYKVLKKISDRKF